MIIFHLYSARVEGLAAFQWSKDNLRKCKVGKHFSLPSLFKWIFSFLSLFSPVTAQLPVFCCMDTSESMGSSGSLKAALSYAEGQEYILVSCRTGDSGWLKYISNTFSTKWDAYHVRLLCPQMPSSGCGSVSSSLPLSCPWDCDDLLFEFLVAQFFFSWEPWASAVLQYMA